MSEQGADRLIQTDVGAHASAMSAPIAQIVRDLVDLLGATTVAVIGGVKETRAVAQWAADREPQRPQVLRFAWQIAQMIAGSQDREMAVAWFHGSNPQLGDKVPMFMLRDEPLEEIQGQLVRAARAFAQRSTGGTSHEK